MAAKSKPLEVLSVADLGLEGQTGAAGARQEITDVVAAESRAARVRSTSTRVTARSASSRSSNRSRSSRRVCHEHFQHLGRRRTLERFAHHHLTGTPQSRAHARRHGRRPSPGATDASLADVAGEYGADDALRRRRPRWRAARRAGRRRRSPRSSQRRRARRDPHPRQLRRSRHRGTTVGAPRPTGAHQRDRTARRGRHSSPSTRSSVAPRP